LTTAVDSITGAFEAAMAWIGSEADVGFFWFRGAKSKDYELIPGAYRRPDYNEMPPLLDFVQEGRAYAEIGELENWRSYYLAQHHGIPTRLLDWTESFVSVRAAIPSIRTSTTTFSTCATSTAGSFQRSGAARNSPISRRMPASMALAITSPLARVASVASPKTPDGE
jgi:hypothetical protein